VTGGPVPRLDIGTLGRGPDLGRGGQGRVSAVRGLLIDNRWPAALKVYAGSVARRLDTGALAAIAGFPATLDRCDRDWLIENTAWPAMIAEDHGAVCGFLMRVVPASFYFDFRTQTQGPLQKPADVAFLLNSDQYVSSSGLQVTDHDRLALLGNLAATLSRLHRLGAVVGDLSPKNVLFSLKGAPSCFIIDCDAMLVRGRTVLPQVHTPDWELPPGEPIATPAADAYKFGLLAIRLFVRDQSSHDQMPLAMVSAELGRLAAASQHQDPSRRPSPELWIPVLDAVVRSLPLRKAGPPARSWSSSTIAAPSPPRPAPEPGPPVVRPRQGGSGRVGRKVASAAAAVASIAVIGVIGLHAVHSASSQSTSNSAGQTSVQSQASALNDLLNSSAASRQTLTTAVQDVDRCQNVSGAVSAISEVASQRASEYTKASALETGLLPNSSALKSDLTSALHYSVLADKDFLTWAQQMQEAKCVTSAAAIDAYDHGVTASDDAVGAKDAFVQLWNSIASSQGYPTRSQVGI
jgi:hypothetical protein